MDKKSSDFNLNKLCRNYKNITIDQFNFIKPQLETYTLADFNSNRHCIFEGLCKLNNLLIIKYFVEKYIISINNTRRVNIRLREKYINKYLMKCVNNFYNDNILKYLLHKFNVKKKNILYGSDDNFLVVLFRSCIINNIFNLFFHILKRFNIKRVDININTFLTICCVSNNGLQLFKLFVEIYNIEYNDPIICVNKQNYLKNFAIANVNMTGNSFDFIKYIIKTCGIQRSDALENMRTFICYNQKIFKYLIKKYKVTKDEILLRKYNYDGGSIEYVIKSYLYMCLHLLKMSMCIKLFKYILKKYKINKHEIIQTKIATHCLLKLKNKKHNYYYVLHHIIIKYKLNISNIIVDTQNPNLNNPNVVLTTNKIKIVSSIFDVKKIICNKCYYYDIYNLIYKKAN